MGRLLFIKYNIKIGGIGWLFFKIEDKIFKTNNAVSYLNKCYENLNESEYSKLLEESFFLRTSKKLDLNNPKTFNEKIQWLKLNDSIPLKTQLADKYLARDWIKKKIGGGYLIPLLGVWGKFDDINFNELPDQFVLKANHGSGWNIVVKDKSKFDVKDAKQKFNIWINTNFAFCAGFEMHYKDIEPKIIAEKYMVQDVGNNNLTDYRFYCFNGVPKQLWVDTDSGTASHKRNIYDMLWNEIDLICTWPKGQGYSIDVSNLEKMKELATIMSQDFKFVRVDFFFINNKIYAGELTFTPMSGYGKFEPEEWNLKLGNELLLK